MLVQGLTAYLLLDQVQVKKGDVVLIAAAAGGVGSLAVQLAIARGATVIGLAAESKADLVKSLGADHVFDYGKAGWSQEVSKVTRPRGVPVFLDSVGDLASEAFPFYSVSSGGGSSTAFEKATRTRCRLRRSDRSSRRTFLSSGSTWGATCSSCRAHSESSSNS